MKLRLTGSLAALAIVLVLLALSVVHYENYKTTQINKQNAQASATQAAFAADAKTITASQSEVSKLTTDRTAICKDMVDLSTIKVPVAAPAECSN